MNNQDKIRLPQKLADKINRIGFQDAQSIQSVKDVIEHFDLRNKVLVEELPRGVHVIPAKDDDHIYFVVRVVTGKTGEADGLSCWRISRQNVALHGAIVVKETLTGIVEETVKVWCKMRGYDPEGIEPVFQYEPPPEIKEFMDLLGKVVDKAIAKLNPKQEDEGEESNPLKRRFDPDILGLN